MTGVMQFIRSPHSVAASAAISLLDALSDRPEENTYMLVAYITFAPVDDSWIGGVAMFDIDVNGTIYPTVAVSVVPTPSGNAVVSSMFPTSGSSRI
jgi:hypothetical protein